MATREFLDARGREWMVWEVQPGAALSGEPGRRRILVAPEFRDGWLAFQAADERRRLAPVPPGWTELADAELERYCAAARPVS